MAVSRSELRAYWRRVAGRAARDAWAQVVGSVLTPALVTTASGGLYWLIKGPTGAKEQMIGVAFVVLANVVVFLLVFVARLLYTPPLLDKEAGLDLAGESPPPFAIRADRMMTSLGPGALGNNVQVAVFILNRSRTERVVLEFMLCLKPKEGPITEDWIGVRGWGGVEPSLGPQEHTSGTLEFSAIRQLPEAGEILLQVADVVSGRWARFRLPGSYPPTFFVLSPSPSSSATNEGP